MLPARVAETIRRYRMFSPGARVGVAVSGGADSVCLLHILCELTAEWDLHLSVLHLNHGLRGEESLADEHSVRALAGRLGLPAVVRSTDLTASGANLEQAARQARLRFFEEQLAVGSMDCVATAHTANDQAETVLFRFLRGAGGAGLAAIRPVTPPGLVRPLLDVRREEVERYLRERGIEWREDSSNANLRFARNRIRHRLLPQLETEWNPAIADTLRRTAEWALAEEEYWDGEVGRMAAQFLIERERAVLLRTEILRELPLAAGRRLVRRAIESAKGSLLGIEFSHIERTMHLAAGTAGHGRVETPGVKVERSLDWLRFLASAEECKSFQGYRLPVRVPGVVAVPGTAKAIALELIEKPETLEAPDSVYNSETGWVDWCVLSGSLEIRNWMPGDQYQPAGSAIAEKLKTLFQKARIPRWERRHWPVLTDGPAIVWAGQFGVAAAFAAKSGSTKLLRIRETDAPAESGIGDCAAGV